MCRTRCIRPDTASFLLRTCAATFVLVAATVSGQDATQRKGGSDAGGPYPRLPGAVTRAPEGLDANSPFDIKKFFATLPRERNAAPLYLDALFEFASGMAVCFPDGPDRERRRQAAADRHQRYLKLHESLRKNPKAVSSSAADEVIKLYDTGFRKLADAQRRGQCVFESGLGVADLIPHVQEAPQVARIAALRVRRAVERGDFDGAMRDIETVLRLARDLQPRGFAINQVIATAMSEFVCGEMVPQILSAPGLSMKHCDRMLNLLTTHESKSIDSYTEALRMQYVMTRLMVCDLVRNQRMVAEKLGVKPGDSVVNSLASRHLGGGRPIGFKPFADDVDAQVARTSAAKLTTKERELGRYYGALLQLQGTLYADRIQQAVAIKLAGGDDILSRVVTLMTPTPERLVRAIARPTASIRATECLIALRRWQLGHPGTPGDIASVIKGSPLKAVPIDPYDGKSMRLKSIDGQPVVYSVGRDGKDDAALTDADRDERPNGDLIYRLPPVQTRR
jgi:hypothetical protein